ncbi:MAG: ribonuclease Y [Oscillospiraceae bacterium]|nr:ribonuclease Y [Oscillospiraceae bacterium]
MEWYHILYIVIGVLVGVILGILGGMAIYKAKHKDAEEKIRNADNEAIRIYNERISSGESRKKEMLLEAKDEIHKLRTEHEKEMKERKAEISKQERRLQQKEDTLDKKSDAYERKEEDLNRKLAKVTETQAAAEEIKKQQLETLEKISGLTQEQAKQYLLESIEEEVRHDAAMKIKEIEAELKDQAEDKAREVISTAIQRCAADHAAEVTVSVVALPNDEMKGRIIGREGRNIRTLETITGVDLIIDDTPEAITVSSFDPVRREIARLALEKLIADGRIHPTRIEDMVEKAKKEVDRTIREEGERACYETGVHNLNPELVKILGRQKYRTSYGQNVLNHSIEVAHIAGLMASELGIDAALAKRAGLLHDLGKSIDHEVEGSHVQLGADLVRKYKENPVVVNAVEAHHGDVEPKTIIAVLVQAADAISAARPGARRENVENYIRRLQKLEELTGSYPGVDKAFAIQAGREVRIMVKPEVVTEDNMIILARDIAKKIESELEYPGQIKVNVIRETKAVEFAK